MTWEESKALYRKIKGCGRESNVISASIKMVYSFCTEEGIEESYQNLLKIMKNENIKPPRLSSEDNFNECKASIINLQRAFFSSGINLQNIRGETDLRALKFLINTRGWFSESRDPKVKEVVERIMVLEPANEIATRLYLSLRAFDIVEGKRESDFRQSENAEKDFRWASSYLPDDNPYKPELEFMGRLDPNHFQESVTELAEELTEKYPYSGFGYYILGTYINLGNSPETTREAINYLEEALRKEPENQEYQKAINSIKLGQEYLGHVGHVPTYEELLPN